MAWGVYVRPRLVKPTSKDNIIENNTPLFYFKLVKQAQTRFSCNNSTFLCSGHRFWRVSFHVGWTLLILNLNLKESFGSLRLRLWDSSEGHQAQFRSDVVHIRFAIRLASVPLKCPWHNDETTCVKIHRDYSNALGSSIGDRLQHRLQGDTKNSQRDLRKY